MPVPQIWQQSSGRPLDLPFSHHQEAFPSDAAAVVKLGGETPTQNISLMCWKLGGRCVSHCCVNTAQGMAFSSETQALTDCSSGDKLFNEPHQQAAAVQAG